MQHETPEDIRLKPCPRCGGQPVLLIAPGWPHPRMHVECSACGKPGAVIYYVPGEGPTYCGNDMQFFLPGLAKARQDAAEDWNGRVCADD